MDLSGNLYETPAPAQGSELFIPLLERPTLRIESIRSWLLSPGEWYDQDEDEWVVLLTGEARLEIDGTVRSLAAGDYLFIPKHLRHRVLWTSDNALWLGVFSS